MSKLVWLWCVNMKVVVNANSKNLFARIEELQKQLDSSLKEVEGLKESRERQVQMVSNLVSRCNYSLKLFFI